MSVDLTPNIEGILDRLRGLAHGGDGLIDEILDIFNRLSRLVSRALDGIDDVFFQLFNIVLHRPLGVVLIAKCFGIVFHDGSLLPGSATPTGGRPRPLRLDQKLANRSFHHRADPVIGLKVVPTFENARREAAR